MIEADLWLYRTLEASKKRGDSEQTEVENLLFRPSQKWIKRHCGEKFEAQFKPQIVKLAEDFGLPQALNMSVEEYLNSLPKVSDEPFNEIAHHTGETRFRPLLVEARLPLDELFKIGDFKFPKGLTKTFREHDAFFLVGDPYIVWPVNPQAKDNPPQQMVLRKEDGKFRRRGIGIYEAVNLVLQSQAEGVLAKIPYHREDFFNRITEDDRYYDDLTLGIQNGKPFIKCPDLATC